MLLVDRQHETVTAGELPTDRWFAALATAADTATPAEATATVNEADSTTATDWSRQVALLDARILEAQRRYIFDFNQLKGKDLDQVFPLYRRAAEVCSAPFRERAECHVQSSDLSRP